jgi:hypothetical protein
MQAKTVDVRTYSNTGLTRLRFHGVHPDQLETILYALERARSIQGTQHDSVALDLICLTFLAVQPEGTGSHG